MLGANDVPQVRADAVLAALFERMALQALLVGLVTGGFVSGRKHGPPIGGRVGLLPARWLVAIAIFCDFDLDTLLVAVMGFHHHVDADIHADDEKRCCQNGSENFVPLEGIHGRESVYRALRRMGLP